MVGKQGVGGEGGVCCQLVAPPLSFILFPSVIPFIPTIMILPFSTDCQEIDRLPMPKTDLIETRQILKFSQRLCIILAETQKSTQRERERLPLRATVGATCK